MRTPKIVTTRALELSVAVVLGAILSAGGYAVASSGTTAATTMIHACADKRTGVLHLDRRGRCRHSQTPVSWNQAGSPGPAGPTGAPAVRAWATVAASGQAWGQGLLVQRVSTGDYLVTVTVPGCGSGPNSAPVVSVSNAYPPNGQSAGSYPVAWVGNGAGGAEQFDVRTGLVTGGSSFQPADQDFNVQEACS